MRKLFVLLTIAGLFVLPLTAHADSWKTIPLKANTTGAPDAIAVGASADSSVSQPIDLWAWGMPTTVTNPTAKADEANAAFTNIWLTATWTGAATVPNSPDTLICYAQTSPNLTTWTTGEAIVTQGTGAITVAAGGATTSTAYIFSTSSSLACSSQQLPIVPMRYLRILFKNVGTQTAVTDLTGWVTYVKGGKDF